MVSVLCAYYFMKFYDKKSKYVTKKRSHRRKKESDKYRSIKGIHKCRICLNAGTIALFNDKGFSEFSSVFTALCGFAISSQDNFPKHLCSTCYKQLQGALEFRKNALKSNEILKHKLKPEIPSDDDHNYASVNSPAQEQPEVKKIVRKRLVSYDKDNILIKYFSDYECNSKFKKVKCLLCSKVIVKSYYRDHYALHNPNATRFVCHVCGKGFLQRAAFLNHRFTHSTDFVYKCKVCPYKGKSPALLKMHIRTHTRNYMYMCTECPARFLTKSNLNKHTLKHKEPTFKCDSCKKAFHTELLLQRHYDVGHLGIKNHICSDCGKAFGFRKALMQHEREVHKRKKHSYGRMPCYLRAEKEQTEVLPPSP